MVLVFQHPMNRVARQAAPGCEGDDAAALQPAEPAFSGSPQATVPIKPQFVNTPRAQPIGGSILLAHLTTGEIDDVTRQERDPKAALSWIDGQISDDVLAP